MQLLTKKLMKIAIWLKSNSEFLDTSETWFLNHASVITWNVKIYSEIVQNLRDFRFPPQSSWELHSAVLLRTTQKNAVLVQDLTDGYFVIVVC
jgi:hypothetical protein